MDQTGIADKIALLRQAIEAQEKLRETLGDAAVDATVSGLRRQLERLHDAERQQVTDEQIKGRDVEPVERAPRVVDRRHAVVLCARFTLKSESTDGAAFDDDLQRFLDTMQPLIAVRGGQPEPGEARSLLVCFGLRGSSRDRAEAALGAALDLLENAARFALSHDHALQLGIGLRDGLMMGVEASGDATDPTQEGVLRSAHPASRADAEAMALCAGPGAILVDEPIHRLTKATRPFESWGRLRLPASTAPVSVWELVHRGRGSRGAGRLATGPLVGRAVEWARLQAASKSVASGRGGVCWVRGEAGIGKTRLIQEARAELVQPDWLWLETTCRESDRLRPHAVVRGLLRSWLSPRTQPDDPRSAWQDLCETVADLGHEEEMPVWQPALALIAGIPVPDELRELLEHLDGQAVGMLGRFGLTVLLEHAAALRPVVVVCDDLHLADDSSLWLLQHMISAVDRCALWLLIATDTDPREAMTELRRQARLAKRFDALDPTPLPREESLAMVHGLLGLSDLPPRLEGMVLDGCGGHPFTLETACHSLMDRGAVVREAAVGKTALTQAAWHVNLPATLAEMVVARVAGLDVLQREIVEMLSAHTGGLEAASLEVLGVSARESRDALRALRQRRLVAVSDDGSISLAHPLIQRHLYVSLEIRQRRGLHLSWARSLESRSEGAGQATAEPALLAWQFARGGDWERAHVHLQRAADRARLQGAAAEFIACADMLRETAGRAGATGTSALRQADLERQLADAWMWQGRPAQAVEAYSRALEQLGAVSPAQEQGSALVRTSQRLRLEGQRLLSGVLGRPEKRQLSREAAQTTKAMWGMAVALQRTQPRRALAAWRALNDHGQREGDNLAQVRAELGFWARAEQQRRGKEAGEHLLRARRAAEALDRPVESARVDLGAAWHAAYAGDREAAQAYSGRGAEAAWACGDLCLFGRHRTLTAWMLFHGGRLTAAREVYEDLEEVSLRAGDRGCAAFAQVGLAQLVRRAEGPGAAAALLVAAVTSAGQEHPSAAVVALAEAWLTQTQLGHDRDPSPVLRKIAAVRALPHRRLAVDHAALVMCEGILLAGERAGSAGRALAMEEAARLLAETEVSSVPHPWRGVALRLQGRLQQMRGRRDRARQSLEAAVEAAGDAEALLVQADAMVELARLTGEASGLHAARHMYQECGALASLAAAEISPQQTATS